MTMVEPRQRSLDEGTSVEVRNRFDGRWSRGFEIAEVVTGGFRVRRRSDGTVLPVTFEADQVRREHKRGTWWF